MIFLRAPSLIVVHLVYLNVVRPCFTRCDLNFLCSLADLHLESVWIHVWSWCSDRATTKWSCRIQIPSVVEIPNLSTKMIGNLGGTNGWVPESSSTVKSPKYLSRTLWVVSNFLWKLIRSDSICRNIQLSNLGFLLPYLDFRICS